MKWIYWRWFAFISYFVILCCFTTSNSNLNCIVRIYERDPGEKCGLSCAKPTNETVAIDEKFICTGDTAIQDLKLDAITQIGIALRNSSWKFCNYFFYAELSVQLARVLSLGTLSTKYTSVSIEMQDLRLTLAVQCFSF